MRRLTLIRHGRTLGSELHLYYGSTDLPLTEEGLRELRRNAPSYPPADGCRICTTGLLRTEQTLAALYGDVPHDVLPGFREVDFGSFEMKSYDELKDLPEYQTWLAGDYMHNTPPGGESFAHAQERVLHTLAELRRGPEDVLAVAHGGTVISVMLRLFPDERKTQYEWLTPPGFGYEIDLKKRAFRRIPF